MVTFPNISNVYARYTASSVISSGGQVITWLDQRGDRHLFAQRGSMIRQENRALNKHPILNFSGGSLANTELALNQPFTLCVVASVKGRDEHPYYETDSALFGDGRYGVSFDHLTNITRPSLVFDFGEKSESEMILGSGFRLITLVVDGSVMYRVNTSNRAVTGGGGNKNLNSVVVGHPYFHGDIAELAVFDRGLSASEIDQVESYFLAKYDLSPNLPLPVVNPVPDIMAGDNVALDGSDSVNPLAGTLAYRWSFVYPEVRKPELHPSNSAPQVSFTAGKGVYYVELEVENSSGTSNTIAAVEIEDPPPERPPLRDILVGVADLVVSSQLSSEAQVEGLDENPVLFACESSLSADSVVYRTHEGVADLSGTTDMLSTGVSIRPIEATLTVSSATEAHPTKQVPAEATLTVSASVDAQEDGGVTKPPKKP